MRGLFVHDHRLIFLYNKTSNGDDPCVGQINKSLFIFKIKLMYIESIVRDVFQVKCEKTRLFLEQKVFTNSCETFFWVSFDDQIYTHT